MEANQRNHELLSRQTYGDSIIEEQLQLQGVMEYNVDTDEEEGGGGGESSPAEKDKRKKLGGGRRWTSSSSSSSSIINCQAERCGADLTDAKRYHRRHKVCDFHSKAPIVLVAGLRQRFCQQCSRFHEISEFDEAKRSCRRRLAGHNERRRKSSSAETTYGVGDSSSSTTKTDHHDQRSAAKFQISTLHPNSSFKQFHTR